MYLIRENSHNNEISTFYEKSERKFYKITCSKYGKKLIENEINGISFFNSFNKKNKINYELDKNKNCHRLKVNLIKGKKTNYNYSFEKNFHYFEKFIDYYFFNWPKSEFQQCHGDLTLDNLIFNKKKISIFDWEHFQKSKKIFYGYDLIYLLIAGLILPGENNFDTQSKVKFKELYKKLYKSSIKKRFLDNPIDNINKVISNVLIEQFMTSPHKFVTFNCKKKFLNQIKIFINKEIINDRSK